MRQKEKDRERKRENLRNTMLFFKISLRIFNLKCNLKLVSKFSFYFDTASSLQVIILKMYVFK